MSDYDVLVIGAGPAGYVCAIRAAQLGLKTACIEGWVSGRGKPALGGTCLNVGCIPSKALLDSSHHYEFAREHAGAHGVRIEGVSLDLPAMMARKDKVVSVLTQGIAGLFRKHGVEWVQGLGRLAGNGEVVAVSADGSERLLRSRHVVIASGSVPVTLPHLPLDGARIIDSTGALALPEVPARLGIVGAGVIGLELGSVWRRLGAEVTLLEALDDFLPAVDREVAAEAARVYARQGLDIRLGARVTGASADDSGVEVTWDASSGGERTRFDRLVVAVGRRPNTGALGAERVGLAIDGRGYVVVDESCRTNLPDVWAIGDCVRGPMLAHKASEEGVAVAERIAGLASHVDYAHVPWVIYTWPEIAWAGATQQALEQEGRSFRVGTFPFMASGRARAMNETGGFVKLLADARTDTLLGVHVIGPQASELVAEAVTVMAFGGSAEDVARTVHAHPTLAETLHEAALASAGRALHI